jgi:hypothetical protein
MTTNSSPILLISSTILAVVLGANLWLSRSLRSDLREYQNQNKKLIESQATITKARRLEPVLQQFSMRIAHASDKEPKLKELLSKHGLKVTLNVDGKEKKYP